MGELPVRTFTARDAENLLGIPAHRLRYWARIGLVRPAHSDGPRPNYDFRDLVCLRTTQQLIDRGVPARQIARSLHELRRRFPEIADPMREGLKILAFRNKVVVQRGDHFIEGGSGQFVFQFDLAEFGGKVRRGIGVIEEKTKSALDWFREGLQYDGDQATYPRAIEAYLKSVDADPLSPHACVNLGTIYCKLGDLVRAESYYREALRRDPAHLKALFNLGNVLDDFGRCDEALACFLKVLSSDPTFSSARFNLALTYERRGLRRKAREQWKLYLQYDTDSTWAEIARSRLSD